MVKRYRVQRPNTIHQPLWTAHQLTQDNYVRVRASSLLFPPSIKWRMPSSITSDQEPPASIRRGVARQRTYAQFSLLSAWVALYLPVTASQPAMQVLSRTGSQARRSPLFGIYAKGGMCLSETKHQSALRVEIRASSQTHIVPLLAYDMACVFLCPVVRRGPPVRTIYYCIKAGMCK